MICGACGTEAQEWQSFCTECGTTLEISNMSHDILVLPKKMKEADIRQTVSLLRMLQF